MDKQPVGQLPDLTQSNNDDEIMVITNDEYNQLKKEKISDFITDLTSTDENNAIVKGTDGKLFTKDFGNASNITEGTLPVSVLPDIPKDKLPEIETDDLPDSGITAGTYTYPTDIVVNSKGQVTSITEGQAGANNANQDLSNLGPLGLDKINQSKALETGSVSSDADVYADIQKYAHSTFDKSKFSITGSPTISDDGVASGLKANNYIQIKQSEIIGSKLSIKFSYNIENKSSTSSVILCCLVNSAIKIYKANSGYISIFKGSNYGSTFNSYTEGIIDFNLTIENNKIVVYISQNNIVIGNIELSNVTIKNNEIIRYGADENGNIGDILQGSIDLKSIAIWADDVPVFNGNKTGLYIAKPDNYTVEGSPTITEDGVASGFSTSNYITYNKQTLGDNFDIIFPKFKTSNVNQDANYLFSTSGHGLRVQLNSGKIRTLAFYGSDQYPVIQGLTQLQNNAEYLYKISRKKEDSNYTLTAFLSSDNGKTWVQQSQVTMTQDLYNSGSVGYLGGNLNSGDQIFNGSIDLNSFKIYVDGNLVYQPCLKIPYTEADSTSRIVDVAYRGRVKDLYEQTGEALFYTIDEENQDFTLPAGDIYGMITKNREILDIVYPIGRPMPEENNVLLDNEVWLEGATVNIVDYPKLFKVYGTKYGGDGTTTFKLPDMRGRTLWGSPDGSNGYIESKLPNIKGNVHLEGDGGSRAKQTSTASGAFNWINPGTGTSFENTGGNQPWFSDFNFDASRSNSIYSNSAKIVQPPAFKVRWKTRFE